MRNLRGVAIAASAAVLVQGLGTLALGPAADARGGDVTATTRVHVRTSPTTSSHSLTVLDRGESLPSLGSVNGWTKVKYKGRTAYVSSAYLRGASSPTVSESASGHTGSAYTTANLNLRSGGSLSHPVVLVVARGSRVKLTGRVSGDYSQVIHHGKKLWAAKRYLSSHRPSRNLPTIKGRARATAALMVRTSPGRSFINTGDAPRGTIFDLTGVRRHGMAQVVYQGAVRWVNAAYLTSVSRGPRPTAPASPKTTIRYAASTLNVWTTTIGSSSVIGEIAKGATVQVTGVVERGRAQILYRGVLRWVTARHLSATPPAGGKASAGVGRSLNRGYSSGLDRTNANVKAITRDVWNRFPRIKTMYGWRRDVTPDHPAGRAVDVMIPGYKTNQALGWRIANYYRTNAKRFNINYIIFGQKIWSVARNGQGWRSMAGRGGDTANHYDHVHINTYG